MDDHEYDDWFLRLRPLRNFGAPVICRLRRLLKASLRAYGFRAEGYWQAWQRAGEHHYQDGGGI